MHASLNRERGGGYLTYMWEFNRYHAPPNGIIAQYEQMLDSLVLRARDRGPNIIASEFNASDFKVSKPSEQNPP